MSQRRTLILIAAIAIGALASFLVWNYVGGIQDQAYSDAQRVKVFLVKQPISKGTSGNVAAASIVPETIPRKFKPANAIVSLEDIAGKVALSDLVPNQVVVQDMFVPASDPEAQKSFSDNLTKIRNEDQTTFTMNVDLTHGVAGLIVPGDYVNIMVVPSDAGSTTAKGKTDNARFLYQKVQVLAVDRMAVGDSAAAQSSGSGDAAAAPAAVQNTGLLTLIVPAKAAQTLASFPAGNLYLSLVSRDYKPVPQDQVDLSTLPGEDAGQVTPYGPEGARNTK